MSGAETVLLSPSSPEAHFRVSEDLIVNQRLTAAPCWQPICFAATLIFKAGVNGSRRVGLRPVKYFQNQDVISVEHRRKRKPGVCDGNPHQDWECGWQPAGFFAMPHPRRIGFGQCEDFSIFPPLSASIDFAVPRLVLFGRPIGPCSRSRLIALNLVGAGQRADGATRQYPGSGIVGRTVRIYTTRKYNRNACDS